MHVINNYWMRMRYQEFFTPRSIFLTRNILTRNPDRIHQTIAIFLRHSVHTPNLVVSFTTGLFTNCVVTAAMVVFQFKRILIRLFCLEHQHGRHAFAELIPGEWVQMLYCVNEAHNSPTTTYRWIVCLICPVKLKVRQTGCTVCDSFRQTV
jgi:hypothetical protein